MLLSKPPSKLIQLNGLLYSTELEISKNKNIKDKIHYRIVIFSFEWRECFSPSLFNVDNRISYVELLTQII